MVRSSRLLVVVWCGFTGLIGLSIFQTPLGVAFLHEKLYRELTLESCEGESHLRQELSEEPDRERLYKRAMELARSQRIREAVELLRCGASRYPEDIRFLLELAGLAFKKKDLDRAASYLKRALKLDPTHVYANNFLGTVFLLQDNLEAALKYWNQIGKPLISSVDLTPEVGMSPILVNRILRAVPSQVLYREDLLDTEATLNSFSFLLVRSSGLEPLPDDTYNLELRIARRKGLLGGFRSAVVSSLRGLPFETVHFDLPNLDPGGLSIYSTVRWDRLKRRLEISAVRHWVENPSWSFRVLTDLRDEEWRLPHLSSFGQNRASDFELQRRDFGFFMQKLSGYKWSWTGGFRLTDREWTSLTGLPFSDLPQGVSIHYQTEVGTTLYSSPERGVKIASRVKGGFGRFFQNHEPTVGTVEGELELKWPTREGRILSSLKVGEKFGTLPADELFNIGLDRDNPGGMRAHISTTDGRIGTGPLTNRFLLSRSEFERELLNLGLITIEIAPFFDLGKVSEGPLLALEETWLIDTGLQLKIKTPAGVSIVISWGKDIRTGKSAWYAYTNPGQ